MSRPTETDAALNFCQEMADCVSPIHPELLNSQTRGCRLTGPDKNRECKPRHPVSQGIPGHRLEGGEKKSMNAGATIRIGIV